MRKKSTKAKYEEGRGTGHGADYKPWIRVQEINSFGTCMEITDWIHGRRVHCLSMGEAMHYVITRFDQNVTDFREQYPLPITETTEIARDLGMKRIGQLGEPLTTDALIDYADGSQKAVSVKYSRTEMEKKAVKNRTKVEQIYWESQNVPFETVFKEDLNLTYYENIMLVIRYYDPASVHDTMSQIKHDIATQKIIVDMEQEKLNFHKIRRLYYAD